MLEIVAEISCNHNKSKQILDDLLDELLSSEDVTCIKLQAFQAHSCTSEKRNFALDNGPWTGHCLYELMVKAETPLQLINHAAARIRQNKKKLMLSINSWEDLELISHLHPDFIKLPSPESLDVVLAKKILVNGYNLVISTGVISDSELEQVVSQLEPLIDKKNSLTVLHCVSEYPTDFSKVNLCRLNKFKSISSVALIGISDHSQGDHVPLLSLGYGVSMIEKHVMPDSENFKSLDSSFSMTVSDFLRMARRISLSSIIIGSEKIPASSSDCISEKYWQNRISAHASRALEAGKLISTEDVVMLRPGDGISPLSIQNYFGKQLSRSVPAGYPIRETDFC